MAWKELMTERPYRRCTRSPWAFCATSVMASIAPARKSAAANRPTVPENPAATIPAAVSSVPATAARADPSRRMTTPAASPAATAPAGNAATASPYPAFPMPRASLICGYLGRRLAKRAPLVKKSTATATRARRTATGGRVATSTVMRGSL